MTTKRKYFLLLSIVSVLAAYIIALQLIQTDAVIFGAVPFDNIPMAKIITDGRQYILGVDFSVDLGDETQVQKNIDARSAKNMLLDSVVNGSSLQLECDSNDQCGTSLGPLLTKLYLVSGDAQDDEIANSLPVVEIKSNKCGALSIRECANFNFTIPDNALSENYKIAIDVSFDEARWIFVNPVKILK